MNRICAAALAALALASASASAEEVTLKLTTLAKPDFSRNTQVLTPWTEKVNADGKGEMGGGACPRPRAIRATESSHASRWRCGSATVGARIAP